MINLIAFYFIAFLVINLFIFVGVLSIEKATKIGLNDYSMIGFKTLAISKTASDFKTRMESQL